MWQLLPTDSQLYLLNDGVSTSPQDKVTSSRIGQSQQDSLLIKALWFSRNSFNKHC